MLVVVGTLHPDRRVPPGSVVEVDPVVDCGNEFGSCRECVPVVVFVLEARPERFGRAVVPADSGRAHGSAQPVPETGSRGQVRGVFPAAIRVQDRAPALPAAKGHGRVDGRGDHVGADMIGDGVAQHFAGMG